MNHGNNLCYVTISCYDTICDCNEETVVVVLNMENAKTYIANFKVNNCNENYELEVACVYETYWENGILKYGKCIYTEF